MQYSEIINIVKKYADNLARSGISFDAVYLFGSYAKGKPHAGSDIDVAVVSPILEKEYDTGRFMLWKLRRAIDLRIEPHGFAPEDWSDLNPMVNEIKKTGLQIA